MRSIIVFPRRAYNSEYVFLKKESINRDLLFNWMPKINGHFPDGVVMNMNIQLPYFRSITYRFNMSPSERDQTMLWKKSRIVLDFVVRANFTLEIVQKNQVRIHLKSLLPSAICVKRLTSRLNLSNVQVRSNLNKQTVARYWFSIQQWTSFDPRQSFTLLNRLQFDTNYRICIRCRERSNDSYSIATCQTIRTLKKICKKSKDFISNRLDLLYRLSNDCNCHYQCAFYGYPRSDW